MISLLPRVPCSSDPPHPWQQCTWAIRADRNMLMNQLIVSLKCRTHFSCILSEILCISDLITSRDSHLTCLGLLLDKQQFQIARFIAHKINPLNDVSKQWSQASGTNFTDQYLHSYSVGEKKVKYYWSHFSLLSRQSGKKPVLAKSFALNQQKNIDLVLYKNLVKWHSQLRVVLLILWTGRTVEMLELCKFNNVCKSRHQQLDAQPVSVSDFYCK